MGWPVMLQNQNRLPQSGEGYWAHGASMPAAMKSSIHFVMVAELMGGAVFGRRAGKWHMDIAWIIDPRAKFRRQKRQSCDMCGSASARISKRRI